MLQMYELRHPHIDRLLAIVFANQFLKCEISSECPFLCVFAVHGTFVCVCVCLSICPSVYPSVCLSVRLSVCLSVFSSVCLSVCLYLGLSVYPSVCPSVRPSLYSSVVCLCLAGWPSPFLSVCSVCVCVCMYVCVQCMRGSIFCGQTCLRVYIRGVFSGSTMYICVCSLNRPCVFVDFFSLSLFGSCEYALLFRCFSSHFREEG